MRDDRGLSAALGVERAHDVRDMHLHRAGGNIESAAYQLVRQAFGQKLEHFELARRQAYRRRVGFFAKRWAYCRGERGCHDDLLDSVNGS